MQWDGETAVGICRKRARGYAKLGCRHGQDVVESQEVERDGRQAQAEQPRTQAGRGAGSTKGCQASGEQLVQMACSEIQRAEEKAGWDTVGC